MEFVEKLRQLIESKTFTKVALCEKIGVTRETLDNYLEGKTSPTTKGVEKMSKKLGMSHFKEESKQAQKTMDMDVWEMIKGSNKIHEESQNMFKLEFERLWGLIEKFGPQSPPLSKDPVVKNGNH